MSYRSVVDPLETLNHRLSSTQVLQQIYYMRQIYNSIVLLLFPLTLDNYTHVLKYLQLNSLCLIFKWSSGLILLAIIRNPLAPGTKQITSEGAIQVATRMPLVRPLWGPYFSSGKSCKYHQMNLDVFATLNSKNNKRS